MKIKISKNGSRTIVALDGMLDTNSAAEFQAEAEKLLESGNADVLIDMTGLQYISSQGIRTILTLIKTFIKRQSKLAFTGIRPAVKEIFDITGLSEAMTIE